MHLRTLPHDRPSPPAPRGPVQRRRALIELSPEVLWLITMVIVAIGAAL